MSVCQGEHCAEERAELEARLREVEAQMDTAIRTTADSLVKESERLYERLREVEAENEGLIAERDAARVQAANSRAEVRKLREGAADLLEATKNWSDVRIHDARNKLRTALAAAPERRYSFITACPECDGDGCPGCSPAAPAEGGEQ